MQHKEWKVVEMKHDEVCIYDHTQNHKLVEVCHFFSSQDGHGYFVPAYEEEAIVQTVVMDGISKEEAEKMATYLTKLVKDLDNAWFSKVYGPCGTHYVNI